jgi:iron complex outermembrane recepter protein
MKFAIAADARYSGSYLASGFAHPMSKIGSYVSLDAAVRIGSDDDRWEVAVIGKNLTNEFYVTGVVDGPSSTPAGNVTGGAGGQLADQLGFGTMPRTVAVQLTTRF